MELKQEGIAPRVWGWAGWMTLFRLAQRSKGDSSWIQMIPDWLPCPKCARSFREYLKDTTGIHKDLFDWLYHHRKKVAWRLFQEDWEKAQGSPPAQKRVLQDWQKRYKSKEYVLELLRSLSDDAFNKKYTYLFGHFMIYNYRDTNKRKSIEMFMTSLIRLLGLPALAHTAWKDSMELWRDWHLLFGGAKKEEDMDKLIIAQNEAWIQKDGKECKC